MAQNYVKTKKKRSSLRFCPFRVLKLSAQVTKREGNAQFCILFYANYTILATQKGGHGTMAPLNTPLEMLYGNHASNYFFLADWLKKLASITIPLTFLNFSETANPQMKMIALLISGLAICAHLWLSVSPYVDCRRVFVKRSFSSRFAKLQSVKTFTELVYLLVHIIFIYLDCRLLKNTGVYFAKL